MAKYYASFLLRYKKGNWNRHEGMLVVTTTKDPDPMKKAIERLEYEYTKVNPAFEFKNVVVQSESEFKNGHTRRELEIGGVELPSIDSGRRGEVSPNGHEALMED